MAPTTRNSAAALAQLPAVISDSSDTSYTWDGSPLTKTVWLQFLQTPLEKDKAVQSLCERGWVISQGKVAVENATHARYLVHFPDIFFDWDAPAPPFSVAAYEARRLDLMKALDAWHVNRSEGEAPPFTLSFYDPSKPSDKPPTFLTLMKKDKDDPPWSSTLDDSEKLRFSIAPEVLSTADAAGAVIISDTISDKEFAQELTRRYNRSARALLRAEYASAKEQLSDEAGSFLHDTADLILRNGPSAVSVSAYNRMAGQYLRLCRSVPDHLQRTDAILADALAASVRRLGDKVKLALELKIALSSAKKNLYKTQSAIRYVLTEQQLEDAQNALSVGGGLALASTGTDPKKTDAGHRERIEAWTPSLGKCRHCNKNGHLNRDCPTWKKEKIKKKEKDTSDTPRAGEAGKALLCHGGASATEVEHYDYTVGAPSCDTEVDIAAFLGGGSQIIDFSEPAAGRAHALVATAGAPIAKHVVSEPSDLVQPDSGDDDESLAVAPRAASLLTAEQANAASVAIANLAARRNQQPHADSAERAVGAAEATAMPAPAVVYQRGPHARPNDDELSMYVITTSTTPGIFYGTFQRPDMLCSIVNGITPPAGTPAAKKIKGADFAAAVTVCSRFGIPPIFRGPWTVAGFSCFNIGDVVTSAAVATAQAQSRDNAVLDDTAAADDSSGPSPPPEWARGVKPRQILNVADEADESSDVTSDDDRDEADLSRAPRGARGGRQITFRLERGEKPPAGSRLVATDADGSRSYLYWGNLYKSAAPNPSPPPSSSSFWLGVSTTINIIALLAAAAATFAYAKAHDAGATLLSSPSTILPCTCIVILLITTLVPARRQGKLPGGPAPAYARATTRQLQQRRPALPKGDTFERTPPDLEAALIRAINQRAPYWFCCTLFSYWVAHCLIKRFSHMLGVEYSSMTLEAPSHTARRLDPLYYCLPRVIARGGLQAARETAAYIRDSCAYWRLQLDISAAAAARPKHNKPPPLASTAEHIQRHTAAPREPPLDDTHAVATPPPPPPVPPPRPGARIQANKLS